MNDSVMKTKRDPMQFYPAKKDSRKRKWFYQKVKLPPINITSIDGPCHTIINSADFFICLKMLIIRWILKKHESWDMRTAWKVPVFGFFWSVFSRIWTEYGEVLSISPHLSWMRENKDQEIAEYGHFTQRNKKERI